MTTNRATLELHELGDRALPSPLALHPLDPLPLPAVVRPAAHPLHGTGSGVYHKPEITIDAGTRRRMRGWIEMDIEVYEWARVQFSGP